jgi:hypothetical protein
MPLVRCRTSGGSNRLHVQIWSTKAASSNGDQTPFGVHLEHVAGPRIVGVDVDYNHQSFNPRVLSMRCCGDGVTWTVERRSWGVTAVLVTVQLEVGTQVTFQHDARQSSGVTDHHVNV